MFVLVSYTLCGALTLRSVEIRRIIGDASVQNSRLGSMIWFLNRLTTVPLPYLKLYFKRIIHLYDINIWDLKVVQIVLSLITNPHTNSITSNFNSLIFFENSCQLYNLDQLFEKWTDPGFFQSPIWELRSFLQTDWSGYFV